MKEIILYTKDGVRKQVLPVTAGSKIRYAMGKEDSLTLRFSVDTPVSFKLGDHVQLLSDIPHSGIYEITELPTPTYDNSTGSYKYEARFDAHYCKWKNKIFKYTPENASSEASWSLTAPLHTHLEVFLRNLKSLGYKYKNQDYVYIIDGTVENKSVAMEYANENMLDALYRMASESAWNCDVWVSGNEIHFGHCESGNAIPLRRGIEVASSQRSESKGVYATRLYAFGGGRNIPRSYGKRFIDSVLTNGLTHFTGVLHNTNYYLDYDDEVDIHFLSGVDKGKTFHVVWRYGNFHPRGEEQIKAQKGDKFEILNFPEEVPDRYLSYGVDGLTVNGVVQKRLMMPRNTPYIDVYPDMTTEEAIEAVVVFDDIYPKRVGTLANVEPVQRDVKDGDKVVDKFTTYQYTDEGLNFKEEYILEGEELKITFQKGKLSGMTFGVQFDPDGKKEQKWEIIRNEDYGRPLPDETLKPEDGDEYVLSGFNIKLVSEAYIPTAEKELEAKARQYAEKIKNDDGTFTVTMNPVWVHDNNKYFACGQKVTFTDDAMFSGSRDLRVLGYEINLDIPYDSPTYTIGQSMPFSRLGNIETQLESVTFKGSTYVSGGGGGNGSNVYIVKRDDATEPSDFNVFSSLRSLKTLLRKDKDDTTEFLLTLLKGAVFGNNKASIDSSGAARLLSAIIGNGKATIDESGIASLVSAIIGNGNARINADGASAFKSATIREGVTSDNFSTGALGSGFALKKDENNDSYLEVDRMMVRKVAIFIELLIQRLRHVGGQIILSPASITCERVEDRADAYRCYFRSTDGNKTVVNEFVVGDQARCQTFNIKPGVHQGVQNQYYWRLVTAIGDDYIDLSKTDCDRGSTVPQAGDDIVQLGNRSDATRQCAIVLAAHGAGAPYFKMYRNINSYVMDGREIIILSREDVSIIANKLQFSTGVNVETAVNTAQNTANSAQSTANSASGKADKVGNDLSVFVSETNGKFEENDRKFASNLEESKYYADQAVQAMPISGKNLFRDTKEGGHWYPNNWGGSDFSVEKITEAVTVGGHALNGYVRFLRNGTQGNGDIKTIADYSPKITKADTRNRYITVSFYARAAQRTAIYLNLSSGGNGEIVAEGEINKEAIISTEWEHKSVTFKTKDEPQYDGLWVWWYWYDAGIPLDMALFQVEFGNRASEWSPSADDVMDYTDQQVGKIPYSGRNLLQMWSMTEANLVPENGEWKENRSKLDYTCDFIPVQPNEQLTLSLHRNIDRTADYFCGQFWAYNANKVGIQSLIANIKWDRNGQMQTVITPEGTAFVRLSLIRGKEKNTWKLERGTKVTDWTPAPEDTAALIEQNASEIKQLPDSITFSVSKKITGGALNYVSGTQGIHETTTWRDENNTEDFGGKFKIHKECGGKYLSAAFKVRFEGCEFGGNPRVKMQVNDQNGWGWYELVANEGRNGSGFALSDRGETFPLDGGLTIPYNGEFVIYSYDLAKPGIQGDGVVSVRFDYVRGGKITVSEIRVWETTADERNATNKEPLPWYPSRWDAGLLDSRITQTANDITLEVENRKSEDEVLSSRIQQTAEQISLKVNEVIGGENLIDGASFLTPNGFDGWTHQGDLLNHGIKNWTEVGSTCLKITFEKNGCGIFKPIGEKGIAIVKEGLTLTYSMDIRRVSEAEFDDSSKMQIGLDEENIKTFDLRDIPTNEWKRISVTTTAGAIRMKNFGLYYYTYKPAPVTVYIKCIKVELGNRATAYMDSDVDSLLATGIDIQKNAITLTADKTTIRNSRGAQIAMFTDKGGKPLIKAEHIDVDNLYVKHLDGATGSFSGRLEAATGSFSGELKAATGTFRGKLESAELNTPVGNIGGFHIQGKNLVSTANSDYNAAITFNHGLTYYQFGNRFYTQNVDSDYGIQIPSYGTRTLSFYINQTIRYQKATYEGEVLEYSYDNVCIANSCEIEYSKLLSKGKYGMQYFALGAGHCVLDGVIEGVCCQKISFSGDNKLTIIDPQGYGNKVTIEQAYDSNTVALPSLGKFKLFCGRGTLTGYFEASMMSMYIINNTDKTVYMIGRNIINMDPWGQSFAGFDFPSLYKGGRRLVNPKDCAIAPHTIMHVMLLDTGDANDRGYFAYVVN